MDLAKEMDVYHPYIYPNYAGKNQVVLEGYREASRERLKRIKTEVDPGGVFERLTPGYFKL
jgi:FAD/FMN-containing dehydrogenase